MRNGLPAQVPVDDGCARVRLQEALESFLDEDLGRGSVAENAAVQDQNICHDLLLAADCWQHGAPRRSATVSSLDTWCRVKWNAADVYWRGQTRGSALIEAGVTFR